VVGGSVAEATHHLHTHQPAQHCGCGSAAANLVSTLYNRHPTCTICTGSPPLPCTPLKRRSSPGSAPKALMHAMQPARWRPAVKPAPKLTHLKVIAPGRRLFCPSPAARLLLCPNAHSRSPGRAPGLARAHRALPAQSRLPPASIAVPLPTATVHLCPLLLFAFDRWPGRKPVWALAVFASCASVLCCACPCFPADFAYRQKAKGGEKRHVSLPFRGSVP